MICSETIWFIIVSGLISSSLLSCNIEKSQYTTSRTALTGQQALPGQKQVATTKGDVRTDCIDSINMDQMFGTKSLGLIDASLLRSKEPTVTVVNYKTHTSILVTCNMVDSKTHKNYQGDYCKITLWTADRSQNLGVSDVFIGVDEIQIPQGLNQDRFIVDAQSCASSRRRSTESECGEAVSVPVSVKKSSNPELSEVLTEMNRNEDTRGAICRNLAQPAGVFIRQNADADLSAEDKILLGFANFIVDIPERFAQICSDNVLEYGIREKIRIEQEEIAETTPQEPQAGLSLLQENASTDSCRSLLKQKNSAASLGLTRTFHSYGGGSFGSKKEGGSCSLEEYDNRDDCLEEGGTWSTQLKDEDAGVKVDLGATFLTAGVILAAGTVYAGTKVSTANNIPANDLQRSHLQDLTPDLQPKSQNSLLNVTEGRPVNPLPERGTLSNSPTSLRATDTKSIDIDFDTKRAVSGAPDFKGDTGSKKGVIALGVASFVTILTGSILRGQGISGSEGADRGTRLTGEVCDKTKDFRCALEDAETQLKALLEEYGVLLARRLELLTAQQQEDVEEVDPGEPEEASETPEDAPPPAQDPEASDQQP